MNGFTVRHEVKNAIRVKGLTIAEASRRAGLSYEVVSAALNGRHRPTRRVMRALGEVLGVAPEILFDDFEEKAADSREEELIARE